MATRGSQQVPPPRPLRLVRKLGTTAAVTISAHGITRNELLEVEKTYRNGSTYKFLENRFNAPKYNFVSDLQGMAPEIRDKYVAATGFEIVIDTAFLQSGSASTILDQLAQLQPIVRLVRYLNVKIEVLASSPFMNSIETFKDCSVRLSLLQVVDKVRSFKGLKRMTVILDLPEHCKEWSHAYVLPFYELETFKHWQVRTQRHGTTNLKEVLTKDIDCMDRKHADFCKEMRRLEQEEAERIQAAQEKLNNVVFTRVSTFKK
ncbi:hypothetical protein EG329_004298 [Mollisiaceae sp. DMI_Dod_QoI]|nr:hypothetical protein EG329_004298 [Helotiales sp. DMI_Dod_QoI]